MSPYERIWIDIRMICVNLFGESDVYDYLPGEVSYPFVFVGEQLKQNERIHKQFLNGRTQITIHFWHNDYRKRGTLNRMMYSLERELQQRYKSNIVGIDTRMLGDNSTGVELLHGVFDINIKF